MENLVIQPGTKYIPLLIHVIRTSRRDAIVLMHPADIGAYMVPLVIAVSCNKSIKSVSFVTAG